MKLVICGNHRQFLNYCAENKLNPHKDKVRCVDSRMDMLGFRDCEVVFYGTWWSREDAMLLRNEADIIRSRMKPTDSEESHDPE